MSKKTTRDRARAGEFPAPPEARQRKRASLTKWAGRFSRLHGGEIPELGAYPLTASGGWWI